jgi:integrase
MKIIGAMGEIRAKFTIKFEVIAKEWLEYKKNRIKESTYYNYLYIIDKYLTPKLKNVSLKKLNKINYNEMLQEMLKSLSSKTIKDISSVLKAILKYVKQNYGIKIDVERIVPPRVELENLKILNKKEKQRLEKRCLKENSLKSLGIVICLNTGMRIGELCALKWEDIDIESRMIHIKKTLQRVYLGEKGLSKVIIDKPKTRSSIRSIPISNKLYDILAPLKKLYDKEDFFLTGSSERYIEPRNYQYVYKILLKQSRVKEYKFHILRHTFASECIEVGMDPKSLSEILGHSNVNITLNRYVHSSIRIKKKFLEKL